MEWYHHLICRIGMSLFNCLVAQVIRRGTKKSNRSTNSVAGILPINGDTPQYPWVGQKKCPWCAFPSNFTKSYELHSNSVCAHNLGVLAKSIFLHLARSDLIVATRNMKFSAVNPLLALFAAALLPAEAEDVTDLLPTEAPEDCVSICTWLQDALLVFSWIGWTCLSHQSQWAVATVPYSSISYSCFRASLLTLTRLCPLVDASFDDFSIHSRARLYDRWIRDPLRSRNYGRFGRSSQRGNLDGVCTHQRGFWGVGPRSPCGSLEQHRCVRVVNSTLSVRMYSDRSTLEHSAKPQLHESRRLSVFDMRWQTIPSILFILRSLDGRVDLPRCCRNCHYQRRPGVHRIDWNGQWKGQPYRLFWWNYVSKGNQQSKRCHAGNHFARYWSLQWSRPCYWSSYAPSLLKKFDTRRGPWWFLFWVM